MWFRFGFKRMVAPELLGGLGLFFLAAVIVLTAAQYYYASRGNPRLHLLRRGHGHALSATQEHESLPVPRGHLDRG